MTTVLNNTYTNALLTAREGSIHSVREHYWHLDDTVAANRSIFVIHDQTILEADLVEFNLFCNSGIFSLDQIKQLEVIRDRLYPKLIAVAGQKRHPNTGDFTSVIDDIHELTAFFFSFAQQQTLPDLLIRSGLMAVIPEVTARVFDPRPSRSVDWDLDTLSDSSYVLDQNMGLGQLTGQTRNVDGTELVQVKFLYDHDEESTHFVSKTRLVPAGSPEFTQALKNRAAAHTFRAVIMTPFILRGLMASSIWDELGMAFSPYIQTGSGKINLTKLRTVIQPWLSRNPGQYLNNDEEYKLLVARLFTLGHELGLDPIGLSMRLTIGETPDESIFGRDGQDAHKSQIFKRCKQKKNFHKDQHFTPDLVWAFLQHRPWEALWQELGLTGETNAMVAGHLYTAYYKGERPHDLNNLYNAYRDGDEVALHEVKRRLAPAVQTAFHEAQAQPILIPIPGREAFGNPNQRLAQEFAQSGFETVYPWLERPRSHGHGVEGLTVANKVRKCETALNLVPSTSLAGRHAIMLDDCIGDGATMLVARRKLQEAGAAHVSTIAMTHMIRKPSDFGAMIRPKVIGR